MPMGGGAMPQMPMGNGMMPPQMPSIPQHPQRTQHPLQHPPQGMMPIQPSQPQMPPQAAPHPAEYTMYEKIREFAQGEANALIFYEALANAAGEGKEQILELIEQKKSVNRDASNFYKTALGATWNPEDIKIEGIHDYRSGLKFAITQEVRLLREALQIFANLTNESHQKMMHTILFNKVADIAFLSAAM